MRNMKQYFPARLEEVDCFLGELRASCAVFSLFYGGPSCMQQGKTPTILFLLFDLYSMAKQSRGRGQAEMGAGESNKTRGCLDLLPSSLTTYVFWVVCPPSSSAPTSLAGWAGQLFCAPPAGEGWDIHCFCLPSPSFPYVSLLPRRDRTR